jgi:hypothetical protein
LGLGLARFAISGPSVLDVARVDLPRLSRNQYDDDWSVAGQLGDGVAQAIAVLEHD